MDARLALVILLTFCVTSPAPAREDPPEIARLIEDLRSGDVQVRRDAAYHLDRLDVATPEVIAALSRALSDRDTQVWSHAVHALAEIGPPAKEAIPSLAEGLRNTSRQVRFRSAHALARIGPASVERLRQSLRRQGGGRSESGEREAACRALEELGEVAREAVPDLIACATGHESSRSEAFTALGEMGPSAVEPLGRLLETTESDADLRLGATRALAALSRTVPGARDPLLGVRADADPRIRATVTLGIHRLRLSDERRLDLLLDALLDEAGEVRQAATHGLGKLEPRVAMPALVERLDSDRPEVVGAVSLAIGAYGTRARSALPALIDAAVKDGRPRGESPLPRALGDLGVAALEPLLDRLDDGELEELSRDHLVDALVAIGPVGLDRLGEALESGPPPRRSAVARALEGLGNAARPALPALIGRLRDEDESVRAAVVRAIGVVGEGTAGTGAEVLQALRDPSRRVRGAALIALGSLEVPAAELLPLLRESLEDDSVEVRLPAARGLLRLGLEARPALSVLGRALRDEDARVRAAAAEALGAFGDDARPFVPDLVKALEAPELELRRAALGSLAMVGEIEPGQLPRLVRCLDEEDSELRLLAVRALGSLGAASREVLPRLREQFASSKGPLRVATLEAITRIEPAEEARIEFLVTALGDGDSYVRLASMRALGEIGTAAQGAVPVLFKKLDDEYERRAAFEALREIRPQSVSILLEACKHRSRFVRGFAADCLGELEWRAREALDELKRLSRDGDNRVRQKARVAVIKIEQSLEKQVRDF